VWIEVSPEWFTSYRKSTIPDWAVDDALLKKIRTNDVKQIISKGRGSVRASFVGRSSVIGGNLPLLVASSKINSVRSTT